MLDSFKFIGRESMHPVEIVSLRQAVGWSGDDPKTWEGVLAQSLVVVGARSDSGELIGVGFVAGNLRHAVLCDLCVHPNHQRRGIGRAIVQERVRAADDLKIAYLYAALSESNSLRSLYEQLGFRTSGNNYFRMRSDSA